MTAKSTDYYLIRVFEILKGGWFGWDWGFISIIIINIINIEVSQMFKNTYQSGFLSILYSIGSKPLQIWNK